MKSSLFKVMTTRPRRKIKLTAMDKTLELLGWAGVVGIWLLAATYYSKLPEIIPIHFNGVGIPDRFGSKDDIFTLPTVTTIIFVGMTVLNRFPHIFNYPSDITEENALREYTMATRLIRYLKLIIVCIFLLISFRTIQIAHGNAETLGGWFLPLILGLIFIPLIYYIIKSFQVKP